MPTLIRRLSQITRHLLTFRFIYGYIYSVLRKYGPMETEHVLLESHNGKEFWGSPYAMLQHMLLNKEFQSKRFIAVAPRKQATDLKKLAPDRVRVVTTKSIRYVWHLATSKWLINDNTFPAYFSRRDSQLYLNLWHGTPLKTLGRHSKDGVVKHVCNAQRNLLHATHLLAPNPHTEETLKDAYMLEGLFNGTLIRCGYPRNDALAQSAKKHSTRPELSIAFMPTWRGSLNAHQNDSRKQVKELQNQLSHLDLLLHPKTTVWVKLHPMVAGEINFGSFDRIREFPSGKPPYEHLACCDALVTDYSSVLFDFALTGRPIIAYAPDIEKYGDERGFYMRPESIPIQKAHTLEEVAELIYQIANNRPPDSKDYKQFFHPYGERELGDSCERLCSTFFDLPSPDKIAPTGYLQTHRRQILLYAGALAPNGISRSFKTLLPLINHDEVDYTVLADTGFDSQETNEFLYNLPESVKFIPLELHAHIGPIEAVQLFWLYFFRRRIKHAPGFLERIWERENRRMLGDSTFDTFINFNGYSWRAALISLGSKWKRVIYVHNEMDKEIDASRVFDHRLLEVSYRTADRVAIVRKGVESGYCTKYYDYSEKATYVPNCLQTDVRGKAMEPLAQAIHASSDPVLMKRIESLLSESNAHRFINLARFSPEKGQERLIEAFERVHALHANTQLFIIGGHGALFNRIKDRAKASPASGAIVVAQGSTNPFPLAHRCNTMVFSSFYEGIGLVLFEALELDLKVISTDIPGPSEFLKKGYGLVVENNTQGLIDGMTAALFGKVPSQQFDTHGHNRAAVNAFESLFRSSSDTRSSAH